MKRSLQRRIQEHIDMEQQVPTDHELLSKLDEFAAEDTEYWQFEPEKRNALNAFFTEIHDLMLVEIVSGNYGASVIIDSLFILCFEVGYKLAKSEEAPS